MFVNTFFKNFTRNREQRNRSRVWHRGLLFKLKKMGIVGNLLLWFKDYLTNRKQRVAKNGKESSWKTVNAGVPRSKLSYQTFRR
jgi:hypothetical protein